MPDNQPKSVIYIDANSGTWGGAENLYLVEVSEEDVEYLVESGNDSDINQFGIDQGEPAISAYAAASWINEHVSTEMRDAFLAKFAPEG